MRPPTRIFQRPFKRSPAILAVFLLSLVWGCAGPLEVAYKARPGPDAPLPATARPVFVAPFTDSRGVDAHYLGAINATVSDITGTRLVMADQAATLVRNAFTEELKARGYAVVPDEQAAKLVLSGDVRRLGLEIGPRDAVEIELSISVAEKETGKTVWSGVAREKGDRFAGVTGNSRLSIVKYLNNSLSNAVKGFLREAGPSLSEGAGYQDGGVRPRQGALRPGSLTVSSADPRAKVYINGVYYGVTPVTVALDPGVYEVTVKARGTKVYSEKVAVREGVLTGLEADLERE